jgi:DNA-binding transcriptional MocR family regulator
MNDLKYTLTRKEFADHLGISRDTLKKRIKRGHYKDQYVIQNRKYLFSGDTRDCPITKNYGGMINRFNSRPIVDFSTGWKPLEVKPKDEYEKYLEDNDIKPSPKKHYY